MNISLEGRLTIPKGSSKSVGVISVLDPKHDITDMKIKSTEIDKVVNLLHNLKLTPLWSPSVDSKDLR
jgi:hypothetical protein